MTSIQKSYSSDMSVAKRAEACVVYKKISAFVKSKTVYSDDTTLKNMTASSTKAKRKRSRKAQAVNAQIRYDNNFILLQFLSVPILMSITVFYHETPI